MGQTGYIGSCPVSWALRFIDPLAFRVEGLQALGLS